MGCVFIVKLTDVVLILFFVFIAIVSPLFDVQIAFPGDYYPKQLVDLKAWYSNEFNDYLVSESPHFFVRLIRVHFLILWPLSVVNLFGFAYGKSWFTTTCLIFGDSFLTSMAAIMGELVGSGRASEKLVVLNSAFMGVAVLAVLRGIIIPAKRPVVERKKKA